MIFLNMCWICKKAKEFVGHLLLQGFLFGMCWVMLRDLALELYAGVFVPLVD